MTAVLTWQEAPGRADASQALQGGIWGPELPAAGPCPRTGRRGQGWGASGRTGLAEAGGGPGVGRRGGGQIPGWGAQKPQRLKPSCFPAHQRPPVLRDRLGLLKAREGFWRGPWAPPPSSPHLGRAKHRARRGGCRDQSPLCSGRTPPEHIMTQVTVPSLRCSRNSGERVSLLQPPSSAPWSGGSVPRPRQSWQLGLHPSTAIPSPAQECICNPPPPKKKQKNKHIRREGFFVLA